MRVADGELARLAVRHGKDEVKGDLLVHGDFLLCKIVDGGVFQAPPVAAAPRHAGPWSFRCLEFGGRRALHAHELVGLERGDLSADREDFVVGQVRRDVLEGARGEFVRARRRRAGDQGEGEL